MAESTKSKMRDITSFTSDQLERAMGKRWIRAQFVLIENGWTYNPDTDAFYAPGELQLDNRLDLLNHALRECAKQFRGFN